MGKIRVDSGLAYEALLALAVVAGNMPVTQFANGPALKQRYAKLPLAIRRSISGLDAGWGVGWADLITLIPSSPAPRGVAELRHRVKAMDPMELKLVMLGYQDAGYRDRLGEDLFRDAAAGKPRAIARFKTRTKRVRMGLVSGPLVEVAAEDVRERVAAILAALPREFYLVNRHTPQLLARAAAQASGITRTLTPEAAVTRLTRGIVASLPNDVLLVPTAIHAPWTHILENESTKVFCFPVTVAEAAEGEPDPDLVALYRALGDATRLRILKRLAAGRATFSQLAQDLGLARSTVFQHALILRTAGVIRLHLDYHGLELNPDRPKLDAELEKFLQ